MDCVELDEKWTPPKEEGSTMQQQQNDTLGTGLDAGAADSDKAQQHDDMSKVDCKKK